MTKDDVEEIKQNNYDDYHMSERDMDYFKELMSLVLKLANSNNVEEKKKLIEEIESLACNKITEDDWYVQEMLEVQELEDNTP
jgi:hypothetical protein